MAPAPPRLLAALPPDRICGVPVIAEECLAQVRAQVAARPSTSGHSHQIVSNLARLTGFERWLMAGVRYPSAFAASVLKILYGITAKNEGDKYVGLVDGALFGASQGMRPGRFMVEYLPFLRHIPPWLPGASSQRLFKEWQAAGTLLKEMPFNDAAAALVSTS